MAEAEQDFFLSTVSQRYHHLLQPMKDMAQTWQIDIANDLENYRATVLAVLDSADPTAINFAEAAMLVSGGANIFAKKVDDLRNQVYETLLTLGKDPSETAVSAPTKRSAKRTTNAASGWQDDDSFPLMPLPSVARNLDLKDVPAHSAFIPRVPLFLLPKELEGDAAASQTPATRASQCTFDEDCGWPLYREIIGSKLLAKAKERIANIAAPQFDEGEDAHQVEDFGRFSLRGYSSVVSDEASPRMSLGGSPRMSLPPEPRRSPELRRQSVSAESLRSFGLRMSEAPRLSEPPAAVQGGSAASTRRRAEARTSTGGSLTFFESRDVHDIMRKRGAIRLIKTPVPQLELLGCGALKKPDASRTASTDKWSSVSKIFPSTSASITETLQRRQMLTLRSKKQMEAERRREAEEYAAAHQNDDAFPPPPEEEEEEEDPGDMEEFEELGLGEKVVLASVAPGAAIDEAELVEELEEQRLAREASLIAEQQQNLRMSTGGPSGDERKEDLYERVKSWQENLEPLMQAQNKRPPFDLTNYTSRILGKLDAQPVARRDSFGPTHEAVSFGQLVAGKPAWDVCRLFLSTLILTNNGNLDIEDSHSDDHGFSVRLVDATKSLAYAVESNSIPATIPSSSQPSAQTVGLAALAFAASPARPKAKVKRRNAARKRIRIDDEDEFSEFSASLSE